MWSFEVGERVTMANLTQFEVKTIGFSEGWVRPEVRGGDVAATLAGDEISNDSTATHFLTNRSKATIVNGI